VACKIQKSAFPRELKQFTTRISTPASIKYRKKTPENNVFPTPVSVPTNKK
jgi:hypothetical protein